MRMVMASTSILSQVTSGNWPATSAAISSHITMPWRCALDLVTTVSSLRGRERASPKAKRMMRSTPARVNMATSVAASSGRPRCTRPPTPAYSPFRVLAHDHPVEFRAADAAQRAGDAGQDARRAHVGVLVERLADGEPQSPQRDVVGNVGHAGRAEQDGVVAFDQVAAVFGHERAGLLVALRAPVEVIEGNREAAVALGAGLQHLDAGRDHLLADAVARNGRNPKRAHVRFPILPLYVGSALNVNS